ncbi:hypothetical protein D3C86_1439940 [compost metagenome]
MVICCRVENNQSLQSFQPDRYTTGSALIQTERTMAAAFVLWKRIQSTAGLRNRHAHCFCQRRNFADPRRQRSEKRKIPRLFGSGKLEQKKETDALLFRIHRFPYPTAAFFCAERNSIR